MGLIKDLMLGGLAVLIGFTIFISILTLFGVFASVKLLNFLIGIPLSYLWTIGLFFTAIMFIKYKYGGKK